MRWVWLGVLLVIGSVLPAQEERTLPKEAAELLAILGREVTDETSAEQRRSETQGWLVAVGDRELGAFGILRPLAAWHAAGKDQRDVHRGELLRWLDESPELPAEELRPHVGRILMWHAVDLADEGRFKELARELPRVLSFEADHASLYWLIGRRARDHEKPEGKAFLQDVVIPGILADHTLEDAERVSVLRRLYEVTYTGPRPFAQVAGPGLDGQTVSTESSLGRVLLVDYWATW